MIRIVDDIDPERPQMVNLLFRDESKFVYIGAKRTLT